MTQIKEEAKASAELIRAALEQHLVEYLPFVINKVEKEFEYSVNMAVLQLMKVANERERKRTRHIFIAAAITFVFTVGGIGFLLGRYKGVV